MKKIGIVSSADKIGGTEISALRICNLLAEKGNQVVYIAPGNMLQNEMPQIKFASYKLSRKNPILLIGAVFSVAKIVKKEHIDIVHCQDAMSCILCCYAKRYLRSNVRIIWHERGIRFKKYTIMSKKYSKYIDKIICNSNFEKTLLMMNRCDPNKLSVIYNAIEMQTSTKERSIVRRELGLKEQDFVIGSIGRLSYEKSVLTLINAASISISSIPNLKILIVGDGEYRNSLEILAKELGIAKQVVFTGFRRDIGNLLEAMDIFAITSLHESFGNVTVEAMLAKVPVLASKVGGILEVVQDKINGLLVPAGDDIEWSNAIMYAYSNMEIMKCFAEQAYKDATDRFSSERFYKEISKVYENL